MKKLLLFIAFALSLNSLALQNETMISGAAKNMTKGTTQAANQDILKLVGVIEKHTTECLKLEQEANKAKSDLVLKELQEKFAHKKAHIKEMQAGKTDLNKLYNEVLSMHNKNMKEWYDLCMKFHQKAKDLYTKHTQEMAQFGGDTAAMTAPADKGILAELFETDEEVDVPDEE